MFDASLKVFYRNWRIKNRHRLSFQ